MTDRQYEDREAQERGEQHGPTIRDKRRIDPETGELRQPAADSRGGSGGAAAGSPEAAPVADGEAEGLRASLAERTADLQRLQAEYVNYKRRVDRDRDVVRRTGIEGVLKDLLSVLDDISSAREHEGELTGGFKAVAEEVQRVATKYGLESYGTKGDPFDPHIHEALMHAHADGITGPTCVEILQPGYRVGERVLRPARVAVAEPDSAAPAADDGGSLTETPSTDAPTADAPSTDDAR